MFEVFGGRELLFVVILKWCVSREKGEGRREKGEGRREKGEGRREKGEGRREKGEGRRERREVVKVCKSTEKGESRMNVHTSAFVDHMAKRK